MIDAAEQFATDHHAHQCRKYNGNPYITHPARVAARVAARPDAHQAMICAAWLHDTIEDCGVTAEELAAIFGDDVAGLVVELTNKPRVEGVNRAARKKQDRDRIRLISRDAKVIKLIDRIDNVNEIDKASDFWPVYAAESRLLLNALAGADVELEAELRSLLEESKTH